jgi:tRNA(fMet)-specific endonuclease VapC
MTKRCLLDTNHMSMAMSRVSHLRDRLQQAHRKGIILGTCVPVLCEIEAGIHQAPDPPSRRRALNRLLEFIRIGPIDPPVAEFYGEVFNDMKRQGKTLSQVDLLIAGLSKQMKAVLLTSDKDFDALPGLQIENWLT